jgi:hypothetical protein
MSIWGSWASFQLQVVSFMAAVLVSRGSQDAHLPHLSLLPVMRFLRVASGPPALPPRKLNAIPTMRCCPPAAKVSRPTRRATAVWRRARRHSRGVALHGIQMEHTGKGRVTAPSGPRPVLPSLAIERRYIAVSHPTNNNAHSGVRCRLWCARPTSRGE